MFGQLVPCGGGTAIALAKPRLLVGRTPDCDVMIPSGTVSSRHCQLELRDGVWHVSDLGSRNGIRIDGVSCKSEALPPGCILSIARLRYELNYTPQADEPPPDENPFGMSLLEKAGLAGKHALDRLPQAEPDERDKKRWNITPE